MQSIIKKSFMDNNSKCVIGTVHRIEELTNWVVRMHPAYLQVETFADISGQPNGKYFVENYGCRTVELYEKSSVIVSGWFINYTNTTIERVCKYELVDTKMELSIVDARPGISIYDFAMSDLQPDSNILIISNDGCDHMHLILEMMQQYGGDVAAIQNKNAPILENFIPCKTYDDIEGLDLDNIILERQSSVHLTICLLDLCADFYHSTKMKQLMTLCKDHKVALLVVTDDISRVPTNCKFWCDYIFCFKNDSEHTAAMYDCVCSHMALFKKHAQLKNYVTPQEQFNIMCDNIFANERHVVVCNLQYKSEDDEILHYKLSNVDESLPSSKEIAAMDHPTLD